MTKIKSTVSVMVEPREQSKSIVFIEITNWTYNVNSGYTVNIRDYIEPEVTADNMNPAPYMGMNTLKTKTKNYTIEQINALYTAIGEGVPALANYTNELNSLLAKALLITTQSEINAEGKTIYGLLPEEWEIVNA